MKDFIVIGGGLIGMLTARELAAGGAQVELLERGTIGQESSWAGGGILSPLYPWRYNAPVTRLAHWSQERYREVAAELLDETGIDPEWTPSGLLMIDDQDERDEAVAWAVNFGYEMEYLRGAGLEHCEPALNAGGRAALWMPEVAQMRNPRLIKAMRKSLEQQRVTITEQCEVKQFLFEGERIVGVISEEGERRAGAVVLAGGAWSGRLLAELGYSLPVEPVRGQMVLFKAEPGVLQRIVLSGERYLIPRRDGRILIGSTLEHVGFQKETTDEARAGLEAVARNLVPALANYPVEHHWAGLRPGSPQGVPFICAHPGLPGLYVNSGHYRNGVVTGLASAHLLADLALQREPTLDPAAYRIDRTASDMDA